MNKNVALLLSSNGTFKCCAVVIRVLAPFEHSLRKSINILAYSSLEYPVVTRLNPRVFTTHTIRDIHLEYSYRIWPNMLCAKSFVDFL